MEITDIILQNITKNTTAIIYIDRELSEAEKKLIAADFSAKLTCPVVVLDIHEQILFEQKRAGKKQAELEALINGSQLPEEIKEQLKDWLAYKKYKYETIGFERLLKITASKVKEYGAAAVSEVIDVSMANMWAGICWERLKKPTTPATVNNSVFSRIDDAISKLGGGL